MTEKKKLGKVKIKTEMGKSNKKIMKTEKEVLMVKISNKIENLRRLITMKRN
jgi:hypothetical protein